MTSIEANTECIGECRKPRSSSRRGLSVCRLRDCPIGVVEDRKVNLRRLQLKYGEQVEETNFTTLTSGRPSKGMPAWKDVHSKQDFAGILGYLRTFQEKRGRHGPIIAPHW